MRRNGLFFLFLNNFAFKFVCSRQAVRFRTVTHKVIHNESEHDAGNARYEECGMPAEGDDDHRSTEVRGTFTDVMRDTENTVIRSELTLTEPLRKRNDTRCGTHRLEAAVEDPH